jgi:hypothetical protein
LQLACVANRELDRVRRVVVSILFILVDDDFVIVTLALLVRVGCWCFGPGFLLGLVFVLELYLRLRVVGPSVEG